MIMIIKMIMMKMKMTATIMKIDNVMIKKKIMKMTTKVDSALPAAPSSLEQLANWQSLLHTQVIAMYLPSICHVFAKYFSGTFQVLPCICQVLGGSVPNSLPCMCISQKFSKVWQSQKMKNYCSRLAKFKNTSTPTWTRSQR